MSKQKLDISEIKEMEKKIQKENGNNFTGSTGLGYNGQWYLVEVKDGEIRNYKSYLELLEDPEYLNNIRKALR